MYVNKRCAELRQRAHADDQDERPPGLRHRPRPGIAPRQLGSLHRSTGPSRDLLSRAMPRAAKHWCRQVAAQRRPAHLRPLAGATRRGRLPHCRGHPGLHPPLRRAAQCRQPAPPSTRWSSRPTTRRSPYPTWKLTPGPTTRKRPADRRPAEFLPGGHPHEGRHVVHLGLTPLALRPPYLRETYLSRARTYSRVCR